MKQCGECRKLDTCDIQDGRAFCKEKKERRFACDYYAEECSEFFRVGWGDTSAAKEAIRRAEEYKKEHESGSCFITTAVVHILKKTDDCQELTVLRKFRKEVLQKDEQYRDILLRYDTVGPVLARALANDENRLQVAIDLYNIYIRGCVQYIESGDIANAVVFYKEMVENMMLKYMTFSEFIPLKARENYAQDAGGHGAIKFKNM